MSANDYNYDVFEVHAEEFTNFPGGTPQATSRAPSFPLEDLDTGKTVEMKELWKGNVALIEFGSFT